MQQNETTHWITLIPFFLTDEKTTPLEIKILALRYSNLFQIGIINKPSKSTLAAYAVKRLPHFSGYIIEDVTTRPRIRNYIYQGELIGPIEYPFLVRFLYLLHKNHFRELPKVKKLGTTDDVRKTGINDNNDDIDLDDFFSNDFKLFKELYKMFPMEFSKDEFWRHYFLDENRWKQFKECF